MNDENVKALREWVREVTSCLNSLPNFPHVWKEDVSRKAAEFENSFKAGLVLSAELR